MLKKIISVAIVAVMILSMAVVAVSAAGTDSAVVGAEAGSAVAADTSDSGTGAGQVIYFDASKWKNVKQVCCHVWERGGDSFFAWQSKKEYCTKKSGGIWEYDLAKLEATTEEKLAGGIKAGKDYCVIFSDLTGVQTFDQTFGTPCIGDTAKVTGKMIENAVDSEKSAYESVWTKNSAKFGPHLAISSIGNLIGSVLCPNEKGAEVIGDWLPVYSSHTNFDVVATLAKAMPKFGVKDITAVFGYIKSKNADADKAALDLMQQQLEKAYAKAYPSAAPAKVDTAKADKIKDAVDKGGSVSNLSSDTSSNTGSGSAATNSSGSGADGQSDTIFFILAAVMILAAGTVVATRKRREA